MINIPEKLAGPVTLEALQTLLDCCSINMQSEPLPGNLAVFEQSVRNSEFYGASNEARKALPKIGLVGRWQIVELFGRNFIIKCALENEDLAAFEEIVGVSIDEMVKLYDLASQKSELRDGSFRSIGEVAKNAFAHALAAAGARPYQSQVQEFASINN